MNYSTRNKMTLGQRRNNKYYLPSSSKLLAVAGKSQLNTNSSQTRHFQIQPWLWAEQLFALSALQLPGGHNSRLQSPGRWLSTVRSARLQPPLILMCMHEWAKLQQRGSPMAKEQEETTCNHEVGERSPRGQLFRARTPWILLDGKRQRASLSV